MLEIVPDIVQITHGIRNIYADIRNVPTGVPCVIFDNKFDGHQEVKTFYAYSYLVS